jgi:hypothetical protein
VFWCIFVLYPVTYDQPQIYTKLLADLKPRCLGPLQHARQEVEIGHCQMLFRLGRYDLVCRHGRPAYKRMLGRLGSQHARTQRMLEVVQMALLMEFRYEDAKALAAQTRLDLV